MATKRKRKDAPEIEPTQLGPASSDPLPSDQLREITRPETFRVFHCPSDPHHVAEFVVTIDTDGVRIWESYIWHPSKLDVSSAHDTGDYEAHEGYCLSWHEIESIGGHANDVMANIERDTREIQLELETWEHIRDREAHRILRAREIQRTENVRRLIDRADVVLSSWMRPPPRPMGTWRQMVARGRERSTFR